MSRAVARSGSIRRAGVDDLLAVTDVLVTALYGGDLAPWLMPDPVRRAAVYPGYLGMLAEPLLAHGRAEAIGADAVALWMDIKGDLPPEPANYEARLGEVCGSDAQRFADLDAAIAGHHPLDQPHAYLAFLAVMPAAQGRGLGSALLEASHAVLDEEKIPAYLEATGLRNRRLYQRHGYRDHGPPFPVGPGGPVLFPMWRSPRP